MSVRRRSRGGNRLRRILLLFTTLILLVGVIYLIWFSPIFEIKEVEISGEDLIANLDVETIKGQNIFFWKIDPNIFDGSHRVAEVTVDKEFLKRKVIITLLARQKYTIWCFNKEDVCYWVDEKGFIFSEAPNLEGSLNLRIIKDSSERKLSLGDQVLEDELFKNLVLAITFMEDLNIEQEEIVIGDLKFKEAVARVKSGPDIYFSLMLDPSFAQNVVKSLRQSGEWNAINYLDLRVPNRAYYNN